MNIQQVDIKTVLPYQNNPRKNDKAVDVVANSIEQYGFQQPIVVDKNMVIIVGHTRYRAAKKLGLSTIPVSIADQLTDEQTNAYRIMDNRSNENSFWDDAKLFEELNALIKDGNKAELAFETGFTESELNKLFNDTSDPIDAYNVSQVTRSKPGDLWILGDHKLLHGDSTKAEDIQRLMADDKIDLLWEDPPYGISYEGVGSIKSPKEAQEDRKIANDNLQGEALTNFLIAHLKAVTPYVKNGSAVYWCHDIRLTHQFKECLLTNGYHISDTLIWKKNRPSAFLADYAKCYEPIFYGWKKGGEHNFYGKGYNLSVTSDNQLEDLTKEQLIKIIKGWHTDVQEFSKEPNKIAKLHPTVKPTKLIAYHIINSSKPKQIVFDGFSGSGATLLAAEKTGRFARCIEFEAKYIDVIITRWQEETGLEATLEDGTKWNDIHKEMYDQNIVDINLTTLFDIGAENE
jgi:site-specific DNA-methyltransferase (adenine-specific)